MLGIRPYWMAVLALLCGSLADGPAEATCCVGGTPKVSTPSVRPPSVTVRPPSVNIRPQDAVTTRRNRDAGPGSSRLGPGRGAVLAPANDAGGAGRGGGSGGRDATNVDEPDGQFPSDEALRQEYREALSDGMHGGLPFYGPIPADFSPTQQSATPSAAPITDTLLQLHQQMQQLQASQDAPQPGPQFGPFRDNYLFEPRPADSEPPSSPANDVAGQMADLAVYMRRLIHQQNNPPPGQPQENPWDSPAYQQHMQQPGSTPPAIPMPMIPPPGLAQ